MNSDCPLAMNGCQYPSETRARKSASMALLAAGTVFSLSPFLLY